MGSKTRAEAMTRFEKNKRFETPARLDGGRKQQAEISLFETEDN